MQCSVTNNWPVSLFPEGPRARALFLTKALLLSWCLLLLAACTNGSINTRVDHSSLFRPSLLHYGSNGEALPLLIFGAPLQPPLSGEKLAQATSMPAQYHPIRLRFIEDPDREIDSVRLVLLINPSRIPQPEAMCREPEKAQSVATQPSSVFVVLCAGSRYVAKGMVSSAAGGTSDIDVLADMLHGLLVDMLRQPRRSPNGPLFARLM